MRQQKLDLLRSFHPFRDHPQLQAVRHRDDGRHQRSVILICADVAHKRLVNLERMHRKALQVGQAGIAGAEIVQRQLDSHVTQLDELAKRALVMLHQNAFGDLQLEGGSGNPCFVQDFPDQAAEVGLFQLPGRQVDGHFQLRVVGIAPDFQLLAGLAQCPLADRHDQAGLFRIGDECATGNRLGSRRLPAQQRFLSAESPWRRYLSDSSYWLYLVHLPLIFALQVMMMRWNFHWSIKFPFILAIAISILYSVIAISFNPPLLVCYSMDAVILDQRKVTCSLLQRAVGVDFFKDVEEMQFKAGMLKGDFGAAHIVMTDSDSGAMLGDARPMASASESFYA
jgi:hypothetical protein